MVFFSISQGEWWMHHLENTTYSISILNRYYRPHRTRARNRGTRAVWSTSCCLEPQKVFIDASHMPFCSNHHSHSSLLAHNRLSSPMTNLEKTGPKYSFLCIHRSYKSFWKYITNTAQRSNGTDGFQFLMVITSLIQSRTTFAFSWPHHILLQ